GYISPFLDARRGAVFTGLYRFSKGKLNVIQPDRYLLMEEWLRELNELNQPVFFLSPDFEKHETLIYESGIETIHAPNSSHLLRPSNLLMLSETEPTVPAHEVVPNYLRVIEAEVNQPIVCFSPDIEKHESLIYESCIETIHAPKSSHILRPSNLLMRSATEPTVPANEVVPN